MLLHRGCWNGARDDVGLLRLLRLSDYAFFEWGTPLKCPPLARQNGPSLLGPQKVRLVILFGPKVQGPRRSGLCSELWARGSWCMVRGARALVLRLRYAVLRLFLDTPAGFESRLPRHLHIAKPR